MLVAMVQPLVAQRYMDRVGRASFYSKAPLEDIEAHTDQALCVLDASSGEVAASLLMKSFQFEKALLQEHFNEKDGTYTAKVEGKITIHGETQPLSTDVEFVVQDNTIKATASFPLRVKDFRITIPSIVARNIAEVIEVRVAFDLRPTG
jgi:polyisoprenoid-binding protein YceI